MSRKIFKAVIPAAGKGMRMRPLSWVVPKEMFPLGRKPMIQLAVEEAVAARIKEICIVLRKGKEIIRDYFQGHNSGVKGSQRLTFVYQERWDGLGGALRVARRFVGQDPFLMIIPDQLLCGAPGSASEQLISQYEFDQPVVLSSMVKIRREETRYFQGSRGFVIDAKTMSYGRAVSISGLQSAATTRRSFGNLTFELRGFGRTIFPATIFPYLTRKFINSRTGEVDLWKTFEEFPKRIPHYGCLLQGRACDVGTFSGYYAYLPLFSRGV